MVFAMLLGLFGCSKGANRAITSLESMTLTQQGMRGTTLHEITVKEEKSELCFYRLVFSNGEDTRVLEKRTVCDTQVIIDCMNTCGILRWNGFHGKHPKTVQDGILFRFSAAVNGGVEIHADGSANFPKGYNDFVRFLDQLLTESVH